MCDGDHATRADVEAIQATLDAILAEQRVTNGRVTATETAAASIGVDLYGDALRGHLGLVTEHREIRGIVLDARAAIRLAKWALPIAGVLTPLFAAAGAALGG